MRKAEARRMFEKAREHVGDSLYTPPDFDKVDLEQFLRKYLWVIYVSGFRYAVVEKHFGTIKASFHDFDLEKIAAPEVHKRGEAPDPPPREGERLPPRMQRDSRQGLESLQEPAQAGRYGRAGCAALGWVPPPEQSLGKESLASRTRKSTTPRSGNAPRLATRPWSN